MPRRCISPSDAPAEASRAQDALQTFTLQSKACALGCRSLVHGGGGGLEADARSDASLMRLTAPYVVQFEAELVEVLVA